MRRLFVLLLLSVTLVEASKLKTFKKETEKKKQEKQTTQPQQNKNKEKESDEDDGFFAELMGTLFRFMFLAWAENRHIYYAAYPYSRADDRWSEYKPPLEPYKKRKFKVPYTLREKPPLEVIEKFPKSKRLMIRDDGGEVRTISEKEYKQYEKSRAAQKAAIADARADWVKKEKTRFDAREKELAQQHNASLNLKNHYFTIWGGGQYLDKETWAYFGGFSSRFFGLLGPMADIRQYRETNDSLTSIEVGLDFSVVQIYSFNLSFYLAYAELHNLTGGGNSFGMKLQFFFARPLSLDIHIGKMSYSFISYLDATARIGYHFDRFRIFVGYKYLGQEAAILDGGELGLQTWF